MTETAPTVTRLWKALTLPQRLAAAEAFWRDDQAADDQVQAVMLIAQQKKFRPKSVLALDVERRARQLATIVNLPEGLAARVLIVYHLARQRPMMGAFLDALGIAHEDGLIQEENVKPDVAKLEAAASKIRAEFPSEEVSLYLNTLLLQDPDTWGGLQSIVQGLARLRAEGLGPAQVMSHET